MGSEIGLTFFLMGGIGITFPKMGSYWDPIGRQVFKNSNSRDYL
jgi:hypothetical protein